MSNEENRHVSRSVSAKRGEEQKCTCAEINVFGEEGRKERWKIKE
jgi:hypothetical protein